MSRVTYIWIALLSALAIAAGCTSEPAAEPVAPPEPVAETPEAEVEASWESQLADVKSGKSSQIRFSGPVNAEQWGQLADGCDGLMVLALPNADIADEQLRLLASLVSLRQLVLGSPVGDSGVEAIAECPSLEILNLPKGKFTDVGLEKLRELPLLTLLRFGSANVTDDGMQHIAEMPNLRFLHLLDVPISDDGIEPLKRCALLESFYIDGGRCSDDGLSCLLKAHPGLHLHVDQLHLAGDEHADDHTP